MTTIFDFSIVHPKEDDFPAIGLSMVDGQWSADKVVIAKRLIEAYHHSIAQQSPLKGITDSDLWSALVRDNLSEMVSIIGDRDEERLARFLLDFGKDYTWFGGITTGLDGYNHWDRDSAAVAYSYFDKLVSLGEALGVLPIENPEHGEAGNWGGNIRRSPAEIAGLIEDRLGIKIAAPLGIMPVAGIDIGGGLLHYRHVNALYLAARLNELTPKGQAICEFGGGLGLVALYLSRFGHSDISIYDIPLVNVISGFFLICALGPDAVVLEGEAGYQSAIRICANWNCTSAGENRFHITANQDSFPEVNRRIFDAYIDCIPRITSKWFLSINHEVENPFSDGGNHLNVSRILGDQPNFQRLYRAPYWLRRGYVEELYDFTVQHDVEQKTGWFGRIFG